jgi:hypothetical protein
MAHAAAIPEQNDMLGHRLFVFASPGDERIHVHAQKGARRRSDERTSIEAVAFAGVGIGKHMWVLVFWFGFDGSIME